MITALLAIDVGGSTSRATLVDHSGNCLGQGRNRGGNPGSNPPDLANAAIVAAVEAAIADADLPGLRIELALLAMAGPKFKPVQEQLETALKALGLAGPVIFTGDLQAMVASVTAATNGYCIVCGTGAGAVRLRNNELDAVIDAAGWLLGDAGSGYWLGHQAVRAVTADLEGRGEKTALTAAILGELDIALTDQRLQDGRPLPYRHFVDKIYAMRPIELARFAPMVIANRTDPVAARLLSEAEDYLVQDFSMVFDPDLAGPIVLGGGIVAHLSGLQSRIGEIVRAAGQVPDIRLVQDGSVGAVVLALRSAGVAVDEAVVQSVITSIAAHGLRARA